MNDVSPLNRALAENLAYHMERRGLKQMALAKKCGVGQTTISLYLNPDRRKPGKDAKPGSAKLTEVEMLAEALEVQAWELLWPLDSAQREAYEKIAAAYKALKQSSAAPVAASLVSDATPPPKPKPTTKSKKTEGVK